MLYDEKLKKVMLDILDERVSGIAGSITDLADKGFIPNRNKINILDWGTILIHAYENGYTAACMMVAPLGAVTFCPSIVKFTI